MSKNSGAVWPFAVASVALMIVPSGCSQRARLTVLLGFVPVRAFASSTHGWAQRGWEKVRPPRPSDEAQRQLEFFRSQVVALHATNGELAAKLDAATAARAVASDPDYELLPADVVVGLDSSPFRHTLVVSRGTRHGVRPGMLALYHTHLVGRVLEAGPWTSRIQLTTDPGFKAGAVSVPRTSDAPLAYSRRDIGVFEGTGGRTAILKWLAAEIPIEDGAYVVTTEDPENRVPKGLILGRVAGIERGRSAYPRVGVTPIVDAQGIVFVLLLKPKP